MPPIAQIPEKQYSKPLGIPFDAPIDKTWRLWCDNLIGWSQMDAYPSMLSFLLSDQVLLAHAGATKTEILKFLRVLHAKAEYRDKTPMQLPFATKEGAKEFVGLLLQLKAKYLPRCAVASMGAMWGLHISRFGSTKKEILAVTRKLEQQALIMAKRFASFPLKHPRDTYLSGYAELYAALLRLHWQADISHLEQDFLHLEAKYASHIMVSVMAKWYRTLLVLKEGREQEASELMKALIHESEPQGWQFLETARYCLIRKENMKELAESYFNTPERSPGSLVYYK